MAILDDASRCLDQPQVVRGILNICASGATGKHLLRMSVNTSSYRMSFQQLDVSSHDSESFDRARYPNLATCGD